MKMLTAVLCFTALCVAGAAFGEEEVICRDAKVAFEVPARGWRVNTDFTAPVAASLENKELNARITISYTDYDIYGFKVDYGFLKDKLEKNEKNNFKVTKPNWPRGPPRVLEFRRARLPSYRGVRDRERNHRMFLLRGEPRARVA